MTNIPHAVLDGVVPVDVPDCECVVGPLPLRRNDRALVFSKTWRQFCREFRIGDSAEPVASQLHNLDEFIKSLRAERKSPATDEIITVLMLLRDLLSNGHTSFKDCK